MLARRLAAQLLSGVPAQTPEAVVERLLAVQGQDPRGARLAIRARSVGLTAVDVDHALTVDRSLVITWVNRGTLHLIGADDYHWLHPLTTPQLRTSNARRLAQEGVSPAAASRGVDVIVRALDSGPLTREELRQLLIAADVPTAGQALVHILLLATIRGHIVRGPMSGRHHAFVLVRDWLPKARRPFNRELALGELAKRYLAGHGPATERDLAQWAGIPLRDARAGLRTIAAKLVQLDSGLTDLAAAGTTHKLPPPRLLGPFDPVLLGWSSRDALVGPNHRRLVTSNGIFRAFVIVDGTAAGLWTLKGNTVSVKPFAPLPGNTQVALDSEARDIVRYLTSDAERHP